MGGLDETLDLTCDRVDQGTALTLAKDKSACLERAIAKIGQNLGFALGFEIVSQLDDCSCEVGFDDVEPIAIKRHTVMLYGNG